MPRGYWIARLDVADPEQYRQYVAASAAAFTKYGTKPLARGGRFQVTEGTGRARNVVREFASFPDAVDCYNSPEYKAAMAHRQPVAEGDFVVVEGLDD